MNKTNLRKFAKLIVKRGVNVQKNQVVYVNASIEAAPLVEYVVEECYKAKASKVTVDWSYQPVSKLNAIYRSLESLSEVPTFVEEELKYKAEVLPAMIHILSDDPDGMDGIDHVKMAKANQKRFPIIRKYREQMDSKYQWTIVGYPGEKWAQKVFPNDTKKNAVKKLEKAILDVTRVSEKDPIKAWDLHNERIHDKCDKLNELNFDYLVFKSDNGTNLKIHLAEDHVWCGGNSPTLESNIWYNANMPSEEVFTMPHRNKVDGIVYSTKPLSYMGQLIENFSIEFKDGKAVNCKAEKGEEILKQMISMDEGASYLGEVALVEVTSPINLSNILFYNTLYDENASCHLALGRAYNDNIKDFDKLSEEELNNKGRNLSMIHVDFMIGCDSTSIEGYTFDGEKVQVFENGKFVL